MTINQLSELISHIEEEHNFFNRKNGQRIVKNITPQINLRGAGTITAINIVGYGWEISFNVKEFKDNKKSFFNTVMTFLDNSGEDESKL